MIAIPKPTTDEAAKQQGEDIVRLVVALLEQGVAKRQIMREVLVKTDTLISVDSISRIDSRRKAKGVVCDLCEAPDSLGIYPGRPWEIEGYVCGGCRSELLAESAERKQEQKRAARDKYNAKRRAERSAARSAKPVKPAKAVSAETERLRAWRESISVAMERARERRDLQDRHGHRQRAFLERIYHDVHPYRLPVITHPFADHDLRGPAFTAWLLAVLASPLPIGHLTDGKVDVIGVRSPSKYTPTRRHRFNFENIQTESA